MRALVSILLVVISIEKSNAQDVWKLVKDEGGIEVYVGKLATSDYVAFKAVMSLKTTKTAIVNVLKEVAKYPEWFAFTASTRLISQPDNEQSFFMETDYPWPFSNECMNYKMSFEKFQDDNLKVAITAIDGTMKCKYSLKKASGYILLKTENERIRITYYFHSEPSQHIPPWLINPKIHEMPFQTFKALQKRLNN
ncbi:hypothetical protein ACAW74_24340 [Fibrella sp. WM1]|uniref:hypothetical protein n=1 Tax=Fibrella musci TaxID=3242485 RepID=UPI003521DBE4